MYCQKCGHEVEQQATTCAFCATSASVNFNETKECKKCHKKIDVNANYCLFCGYDQANLIYTSKPVVQAPVEQQKNKTRLQQFLDDNKNAPEKVDHLKDLLQQLQVPTKEMENLAKNESVKPGIVTSTKLMLRDCMSFNKRMGLADFWWGYAGMCVLTALLAVVLSMIIYLSPTANYPAVMKLCAAVLIVWVLFFYLVTFSGIIRRYHDAEIPSLICLVLFIPGIGELIALLLAMRPQQKNLGLHTFEDPFKKRKK